MSEKTNTTGALDIGAVLSAARMKRDLSIATAAMQSNLSQEIIERLEQNRFAEIGAPVFTRGYLGLYARFLGLNEAAVSQAFNKIKSEPAPELRLTAANIESQARPYRRRSYLGSWLLLIPVVAIGGILLYQLFDNNSWLMTQINGAFNAPRRAAKPPRPKAAAPTAATKSCWKWAALRSRRKARRSPPKARRTSPA